MPPHGRNIQKSQIAKLKFQIAPGSFHLQQMPPHGRDIQKSQIAKLK